MHLLPPRCLYHASLPRLRPSPSVHSLTPTPSPSLPTVTQGNHSAIQSEFATPCIPAHDTNITVNGFNSGFRDAGNGTAITNLPVTISDNSTIWFYDANTCAQGGVGGINVNESSTETLDGFRVSPFSLPSCRRVPYVPMILADLILVSCVTRRGTRSA